MRGPAQSVAAWIAAHGGDPASEPVYVYALERLFTRCLTMGTVLLVSLCLGEFLPAVIWYCFFLPLRQTAGGNHAQSRLVCFLASVAVPLTCMLCLPWLQQVPFLAPAVSLFSVAVTFACAPVLHPHHPLAPGRIAACRRTARLAAASEGTVLLILWLFRWNAAPAALGLLSASVSTLLGALAVRRKAA